MKTKNGIKDGDILELEGGGYAVVKLEEKTTELVVGKDYDLIRTGSFCHQANSDTRNPWKDSEVRTAMFVGTISTRAGKRNIFYEISSGTYYMFSAEGDQRYLSLN